MSIFTGARLLSFVLILAALLAVPATVQAQPSDAQVRKDVMNPGVKRLELTSKPGTKQWNSDTGAWEFVRGVRVIREYPDIEGVDLVVVGDAVYQLYGSNYKYWKFRVASNEYLGIDNPTEEEILAILNQDLGKFLGFWYNRIVGDVREIRLADEPTWFWHKPTSVSFLMTTAYDAKTSDLDVASVEQDYEVRFYRDDYQGPWLNFISTNREQRVLSTQRYSADEVRAMPTLASVNNEQQAQAALASLPQVEVPAFERGIDLIIHTHNLLRTVTAEEFEAYLMQVLAPHYFIEGSTVQLNQRGADVINQNVERAFKKRGTYAQQYCREAGVDKGRSSEKRLYIRGAINNVITMIAVDLYGGKYVEGVKTGQQWKISDLYVGTRQDQDALDFIASFSDRSKLCPKD